MSSDCPVMNLKFSEYQKRIDELKAECERLRGELRDTDERASWHMKEENWLRGELARLQKIAIEETARRLYPFNMPIWGNLPEEDFEKLMFYGTERLHGKRYYREQAARELGIDSSDAQEDCPMITPRGQRPL